MTMLAMPYPAFMSDERRKCLGTDPALFFPGQGERGDAAKAICSRCPFTAECKDYAVTHDLFGVWGGTTEYDRRERKRRVPTSDEVAREKRDGDA